jgi:AcrR family transcriptional regulator
MGPANIGHSGMSNVIFRLSPKGGRRRREKRDDKSFALTDAGVRLLALSDYDSLSMARIAREAGTSVGALYARFPEKNAYLYHLIAAAFRSMREDAKRTLDRSRWPRDTASAIVRQIVSHVVGKMTTPRAAGIIRATIKLATVRPSAVELFEEYRTEVTKLSVALLAPKTEATPDRAIGIAMQIIFATVTDAVMQKNAGPMHAGSKRMIEALTNVMLGYLGLSGSSWAGDESDGADDPADESDLGSDRAPDLDEGETAVFNPGYRTFMGKTGGKHKAQGKRSSQGSAAKADSQLSPRPSAKRSEAQTPISKIVAPPPRPPTPPPETPPKRKLRRRI